jgi:rhamnopyranosyl-N-acetylglucosaminyl-diphospho-decaprenol beta-1,3/1,4-galactofuranosyltransferase
VNRVCAVLVTRNRKSLLREALAAIGELSRPVQGAVVVDNASDDGTGEMLAEEFGHVNVLRLEKNAGSAGGYYVGIDWAYRQGFEWIWTLDDDSIARADALGELLRARERFEEADRPDVLASRVLWSDGSLHPMNVQKPKLYDARRQFLAAENATMSMRFSSFVSMLIHRRMVEKYGLPIPGYFLWNDDVEYSARMLRNEFGVMVPASVVVHQTQEKHVPATSVGGKYFYEVRNKLWIMRGSRAFDRGEKMWMGRSLLRRTWGHLREAGFSRESLGAVGRGIVAGIFGEPERGGPGIVNGGVKVVEVSTIAA